MATQNATDTQNPIQVARGGSGVASVTAYAVLCGGTTSTGALQSIASVGTTGQVLTSNGAAALPTFQDATAGFAGDFETGYGLIYDSSSTWTSYDYRTNTTWYDDFIYIDTAGTRLWPWINGGNGSGNRVICVASESNHPGIVQLETGTTSTGDSALTRMALVDFGDDFIRYEALVRLPTLSTVSEEYNFTIGFADVSAGDSTLTQGIYFRYDRLTSTNWIGGCTSSSVTSTATTATVAVAANTWHHLAYEVNTAATSVTFWVDGTSLGSVTANIPTSATIITNYIKKTAGSTERVAQIDRVQF